MCSMVRIWPQCWQVVGGPRDKIWDFVALVWPIRSYYNFFSSCQVLAFRAELSRNPRCVDIQRKSLLSAAENFHHLIQLWYVSEQNFLLIFTLIGIIEIFSICNFACKSTCAGHLQNTGFLSDVLLNVFISLDLDMKVSKKETKLSRNIIFVAIQ